MTNLFHYQELLFLSFAIKGVEIQRSKVTFWSFQNHRHILTLVKRELRLRRRASSLILYLTLGRCWDKHVSCGNQTVFTKTWLRTWVLQSVWMQEEYNFYTTVWWQQTILQTPEIPDSKPYCKLQKDFLSHWRKLTNDLQNSAKTTYLYCTVV